MGGGQTTVSAYYGVKRKTEISMTAIKRVGDAYEVNISPDHPPKTRVVSEKKWIEATKGYNVTKNAIGFHVEDEDTLYVRRKYFAGRHAQGVITHEILHSVPGPKGYKGSDTVSGYFEEGTVEYLTIATRKIGYKGRGKKFAKGIDTYYSQRTFIGRVMRIIGRKKYLKIWKEGLNKIHQTPALEKSKIEWMDAEVKEAKLNEEYTKDRDTIYNEYLTQRMALDKIDKPNLQQIEDVAVKRDEVDDRIEKRLWKLNKDLLAVKKHEKQARHDRLEENNRNFERIARMLKSKGYPATAKEIEDNFLTMKKTDIDVIINRDFGAQVSPLRPDEIEIQPVKSPRSFSKGMPIKDYETLMHKKLDKIEKIKDPQKRINALDDLDRQSDIMVRKKDGDLIKSVIFSRLDNVHSKAEKEQKIRERKLQQFYKKESDDSKPYYTVYHGTVERNVSSIEEEGLKPPEHMKGSSKWFMVTTEKEAAVHFAKGYDGKPVILEYRIPKDQAQEYLWNGEKTSFNDVQHAVRKPIPKEFITKKYPLKGEEKIPRDKPLIFSGELEGEKFETHIRYKTKDKLVNKLIVHDLTSIADRDKGMYDRIDLYVYEIHLPDEVVYVAKYDSYFGDLTGGFANYSGKTSEEFSSFSEAKAWLRKETKIKSRDMDSTTTYTPEKDGVDRFRSVPIFFEFEPVKKLDTTRKKVMLKEVRNIEKLSEQDRKDVQEGFEVKRLEFKDITVKEKKNPDGTFSYEISGVPRTHKEVDKELEKRAIQTPSLYGTMFIGKKFRDSVENLEGSVEIRDRSVRYSGKTVLKADYKMSVSKQNWERRLSYTAKIDETDGTTEISVQAMNESSNDSISQTIPLNSKTDEKIDEFIVKTSKFYDKYYYAGNKREMKKEAFQSKKLGTIKKSKSKKHASYLSGFYNEVDYKTEKKEHMFMEIDGVVIEKKGAATKVKSHDIVVDLRAKEINSIHNHPEEFPPSNNDIYNFLYSGNHKRYSVVTAKGVNYDLTRTSETSSLTWIDKEQLRKTKSDEITDSMIKDINRDYRGSRIRFGRYYNGVYRAHAKKMGYTTQKEVNENSAKIQEKTLHSLADHYKFEVNIQKD